MRQSSTSFCSWITSISNSIFGEILFQHRPNQLHPRWSVRQGRPGTISQQDTASQQVGPETVSEPQLNTQLPREPTSFISSFSLAGDAAPANTLHTSPGRDEGNSPVLLLDQNHRNSHWYRLWHHPGWQGLGPCPHKRSIPGGCDPCCTPPPPPAPRVLGSNVITDLGGEPSLPDQSPFSARRRSAAARGEIIT